ncbi:hypothetical protein C8Q74DRAFT_115596 [Fomes fomentarius]|nr:hypothetical protein C8Q74DRAFT_115596 [Fomes fomentarius]
MQAAVLLRQTLPQDRLTLTLTYRSSIPGCPQINHSLSYLRLSLISIRRIPHTNMPLNHCVKCGVTPQDGLQNCSRCHGATGVYCSKECQVTHWKVHKPICRVLSPYDVWGIKILDNDHAPWNNQFHHVYLNNSHPIFTRGELCPLTEQCGFPLIIFSQAHNGMSPATQDNQPAVYLRIEPDNGLAPTQ